MEFADLRRQIVETARWMNARGLNQGMSGNLSARAGSGFLITPSALAYSIMQPEDVVFMDDGNPAQGSRKPSTEWRIHADIYAGRRDAGAVIHCHPVHATALACLGRPIPAFHYMVAVAGGSSIRCAPYATFGTRELSDHAQRALEGRKGCLLANHGMIALGPSLADAARLTEELETLARMYLLALGSGEPRILSEEEMRTVLEKFRDYGR